MPSGVFTKCLAVVAACLRRQDIHIYPYLEDWLIRGRSQQETATALEYVLFMFPQLGLLVNFEKLSLSSSQMIAHRASVIDFQLARAYHPEDRF